MTDYTEDNPPAFPRDHRHLGHNGMSLRDYFAGQALLMQSDAMIGFPNVRKGKAEYAYAMADAMLKQRNEL